MTHEELHRLREQIDECDERIFQALAERFELTDKVGEYKARHDLPPMDPEREREQFEKFRRQARDHGLDEELIAELFDRIIRSVKERHETKR